MPLTPEQVAERSHIPDKDVLADIADTEAEISRDQRRIQYHQEVITSLEKSTEERRQFIAVLNELLAARAEARKP